MDTFFPAFTVSTAEGLACDPCMDIHNASSPFLNLVSGAFNGSASTYQQCEESKNRKETRLPLKNWSLLFFSLLEARFSFHLLCQWQCPSCDESDCIGQRPIRSKSKLALVKRECFFVLRLMNQTYKLCRMLHKLRIKGVLFSKCTNRQNKNT